MTIYDADYVPDQWEPTGVKDTDAGSQEINQEGSKGSEVNDDHIVDADKLVPVESEKELNFKALRDAISQEKSQREAERLRHQQELDILRSQMANYQSSTENSQSGSKGALDDLQDDDLLTTGKARQAIEEMQRSYQEQLTHLRHENLENQARLQHSDYNDVMEKFSIPLLRNNKDFARAFQMAENPAEFAYQIGRMHMATQVSSQPVPEIQNSVKAERMIENSRKPGTLSNPRGGQASISKGEYYASMSDAEFANMVRKNLEEV